MRISSHRMPFQSAIMLVSVLSLLQRHSNSVVVSCFSTTTSSYRPIWNHANKMVARTRLLARDSSQSSIDSKSFMEDSLSGYKAPTVNWYPGHIAKAERNLAETLHSADVLVEVRDARIPKATAHPKVREWTAGKPRIVVMTHVDMVPTASVKSWSRALNVLGAGRWDGKVQDGNVRHRANQAMKERGVVGEDGQVENVIYVDAKRGAGMLALMRAISRSGAYVNERRKNRGLRERSLRVAILGYPNVGKSALINRILGRKRARSANTPGVTRALQWIRIKGDVDGTDETGKTRSSKSNNNRVSSGDFELLDSPGIIPANMENQEDALLLAICKSIGDAAYDNQGVAAYLCERLKTLYQLNVEQVTAPQWREKCVERYKFDPLEPIVIPSLDITHEEEKQKRIPTGEDMLFAVAENTCNGDPENAARKILQDFRNGRMGPVCLQLAPKVDDEGGVQLGEKKVVVTRQVTGIGGSFRVNDSDGGAGGSGAVGSKEDEVTKQRAEKAVKIAKEKGLELPPMLDASHGSSISQNESNVGKGLFDGW